MTVAWRDQSDVFEVRHEATVGDATLTVSSVIGGANTDRHPYHWWVQRGDRDVADGPARTIADARHQAEQAAKETA